MFYPLLVNVGALGGGLCGIYDQCGLAPGLGILDAAGGQRIECGLNHLGINLLLILPFDLFFDRLRGSTRLLQNLDCPDQHSYWDSSVIYTLPVGRGHHFAGNVPRWVDTFVGGWDIGSLLI